MAPSGIIENWVQQGNNLSRLLVSGTSVQLFEQAQEIRGAAAYIALAAEQVPQRIAREFLVRSAVLFDRLARKVEREAVKRSSFELESSR